MRTIALAALVLFGARSALAQNQQGPPVQVAIVVDVSQSMRGFTDATRQRVLGLVQKLTGGAGGDSADLALLAYGYGSEGGVRVLAPLTGDWTTEAGDIVWSPTGDEPQSLAATLAENTLRGGREGCGQALQMARIDLAWSEDQNARRFVVIAGNESFDQDTPSGTSQAQQLPRHFKLKVVTLPDGESRTIRIEMPITLHTIHVGMRAEGRRHEWEKAATLGNGTFDNVDPGASR